MAGGIAKLLTWLIRLFQLFFAIILTGILSYMVHEYNDYHWHKPREVIVPEVFSVLALFVTFFSIIAVCFLGHFLQLVAAFLDFAIFVGYLASAALLRHNFHSDSNKNPLKWALTMMRATNGHDDRDNLNSGLVKLLVGVVVIQIILFFITTLLSTYVASRSEDRQSRRTRHAV